MITLKDLAAAVGVSASSVSLVLNGRHEGRVNAQTASRIRTAADDMGYIPNQLARGLKTKRTHTIGVLSDRVASLPFAGRMFEGLQTVAWEAGYLAMIIDTTDRPELMEQSLRSLLQRDVDAIIVASEFHRRIEVPPVPPTIPVVVLDGIPEDPHRADGVVPDESGGAYAAASHLVNAGHRRVAFCNVGGDLYIASQLRYDGYALALRERDLQVDPSLVMTLRTHRRIARTSLCVTSSAARTARPRSSASRTRLLSPPSKRQEISVSPFQGISRSWDSTTRCLSQTRYVPG